MRRRLWHLLWLPSNLLSDLFLDLMFGPEDEIEYTSTTAPKTCANCPLNHG